MKYLDIIRNRITGIGCPIFSISWIPTESSRKISRDVVIFLEDKRVLYVPSEMECPGHCVHSVLDIRSFLTTQLQRTTDDETLSGYIRAMRIACRKFLDRMNRNERKEHDFLRYAGSWGHWASWEFASALGELRGTFGVMLAQLAASYGIDIEDELASILPADESQGDDRDSFI
ncbi:hypothetical protein LJC23_05800 [Desulfovibrio sp. OttesenSCG-928-I05]|nr:hypothetical protein [Desulfovibrio sp. OttesenSCG-928-I05]